MQTFAESTMNELLGWYGYDKVDLRDSEANEIRNYRERRQHVSVLKGEGRCSRIYTNLQVLQVLEQTISHCINLLDSLFPGVVTSQVSFIQIHLLFLITFVLKISVGNCYGFKSCDSIMNH